MSFSGIQEQTNSIKKVIGGPFSIHTVPGQTSYFL